MMMRFGRIVLVFLSVFLSACVGEEAAVESQNTLEDCDETASDVASGNSPFTDGFGTNPAIGAVESGGQVLVYVAWEGLGNRGLPSIFFRRSLDGGMTFEDPFVLAPSDHSSPGLSVPVISATGDRVYLAWVSSSLGEDRVRFAYSQEKGEAGSFTVLDSISGSATRLEALSLAAEDESVFVGWVDLGDFAGSQPEQFLVRSQNGGQNFGNPQQISQRGLAALSPAGLGVEGNRAYAAWEESGDPDPSSGEVSDVWFVLSEDAGNNFSVPMNLSANLNSSRFPALTVSDNGRIFVVWDDLNANQGNTVLSFRRSLDGGKTFELPLQIGVTGTTVPRIASSGDRIGIIWPDSDVNAASRQVFFAGSGDAGQSFGVPLNISQNAVSAQNPDIAQVGTQAFAVWEGQFRPQACEEPQQRIFFAGL